MCGLISEGGARTPWWGWRVCVVWAEGGLEMVSGWVWVCLSCRGQRGFPAPWLSQWVRRNIWSRERALTQWGPLFLLQYSGYPSYFYIYIAVHDKQSKKKGKKTAWCMGCHTESIPTVYKNIFLCTIKKTQMSHTSTHTHTHTGVYLDSVPPNVDSSPAKNSPQQIPKLVYSSKQGISILFYMLNSQKFCK